MVFLIKLYKNWMKIKQKEIPEHYALNVWLYKLCGSWIPHDKESFRAKLWYCFYNITLFLTAGPNLLFQFGSIPDTYNQDFIAFSKNVGFAVNHFGTLFKIAYWIKDHRSLCRILNLLDDMENLHGEYVIAPDTSPDVHMEDFQPKKIMASQRYISDLSLKVFGSAGAALCCSYALSAWYTLFFDHEDKHYTILDEYNVTYDRYDQMLAVYGKIPWDYRSGRFSFFFAITYQLYGILYYSMGIVVFDSLFATNMTFICGHLKIVQSAFTTLRARCLRKLKIKETTLDVEDSPELQEEMKIEFNKCVIHLQQIIITTDFVENIFTNIIFVQLGVTLLTFCTTLYLVSTIPISKDILPEFTYLFTVLNELMLYSYFGHSVTINAETMPDALFNGDWLRANQSFKRSMLITMTRMVRPLHLTLGKFTPLTLSTFLAVCKSSYTFFTVIKSQGI